MGDGSMCIVLNDKRENISRINIYRMNVYIVILKLIKRKFIIIIISFIQL